jgi:hypothetical protein
MRSVVATLLTAALAAGACAPPVAVEPAPRGAAGRDTVVLAMLEHELAPAPDVRGFAAIARRDFPSGPVARVTDLAPADSISAPFVRVALLRASADPRDLLDAAAAGAAGPADVLVTRDPSTIAYARARSEFTVAPLDWDRVHAAIVIDPARTRIAATPELRASLARDAVRADARAAEPPYPWQTAACEGRGPRHPSPARRVVYRRGDPVGRDIAERLVAMDGSVTAAALADDSLSAAVAVGADAVYIAMLPVRADSTVAADVGGPCSAVPARPAGTFIVPLVETRAHAIVRSGTPPLVLAPGVPVRYAADSAR